MPVIRKLPDYTRFDEFFVSFGFDHLQLSETTCNSVNLKKGRIINNMKKCPTCDKEFPDSMRFCQNDGTTLVDAVSAPPEDPFKTTVGRQEDIAAAIPPFDPFATIVGGAKKDESGDLLQLPEDHDPLKTMYVSEKEIRSEMDKFRSGENEIIEIPPVTPPVENPFTQPAPPVFNEPKITPAPNFDKVDLSEQPTAIVPNYFDDIKKSASDSEPENKTAETNFNKTTNFENAPIDDLSGVKPPSPFDASAPNSGFDSSPYGSSGSTGPIPSPFDASMPPGYQPPSAPLPSYQEPEKPALPTFEEPPVNQPFNNTPFNNNPFENPPIGQNAMANPFSDQNQAWTPPPAPDSNWQNQQIGQNTPFQPPVAGGGGLNQTLPIISLVLGIVSLCCYISPLTGLGALITGYLGMKNVNNDPNQYGGKGLAIAGMITGGIFLLIGIAYYILIFLGLAANLATMPR